MVERHLNEREFSLLLSRLQWPSLLVRERAACAICGLLLGPDSALVLEALLKWMEKQTLESVVVLGLLPVYNAYEGGLEVPHEALKAAIRSPSLLSHLLLAEIQGGGLKLSPVDLPHSGSATPGFRPASFFENNVSVFWPPAFSNRAERIERVALVPFRRQWAYEWEELVRREGIAPSVGPLSFQGQRDGEHLFAINTNLSEVYHSAYLRALAWAATTGKVKFSVLLSLAAETCPLDLGLWKVKPGRRPAWWPTVEKSESSIDVAPSQIWKAIERLWAEQDLEKGKTLLAAAGHVHDDSQRAYEIQILGAFQAAEGPTAGSPQEVVTKCGVSLDASVSLLTYTGLLHEVAPSDLAVRSGDWSVVPASGYVMPSASDRWQYWRFFRGLRLPFPFLAGSSLDFKCGTDAIEVSDGHESKAWLRDWTDGMRETTIGNLGPRSGYFLIADSDMVKAFAEKTRSAFSWFCRLTAYHRRYEYGSFEEADLYAAFGTRTIIIPP